MNTYSNKVQYTYDENQKIKEVQVISKLAEIAASFEKKDKESSKENKSPLVRFVGIEDALKELLNFKP